MQKQLLALHGNFQLFDINTIAEDDLRDVLIVPPTTFLNKTGIAKYRGWQVKVHFTNREDTCYIFPRSKIDKKTSVILTCRFVPTSKLSNIQLDPL